MKTHTLKRQDLLILRERRMLSFVNEGASESAEAKGDQEVDPEQATPERVEKIEQNDGIANMAREGAEVAAAAGESEDADQEAPQVSEEGEDGLREEVAPTTEQREKEEQKEQLSDLFGQILELIMNFISQLSRGQGFNLMEFMENGGLRRNIRNVELQMQNIEGALARNDLSPEDRTELTRRHEELQQRYNQLTEQLKQQQAQMMPHGESGERQAPARHSTPEQRQRPAVRPRNAAEAAFFEFLDDTDRMENADPEEFERLLSDVFEGMSGEERREFVYFVAESFNAIAQHMKGNPQEAIASVPPSVREHILQHPEELDAFLEETFVHAADILNGALEKQKIPVRLDMVDGRAVVVALGNPTEQFEEGQEAPSQSQQQSQTVIVNAPAEAVAPEIHNVPQQSPEYTMEDLDTNHLRSYLRSIGVYGSVAVRGEELVLSGIRGGTERERVRAFLGDFPKNAGISRRIVPEAWGSGGTFEARVQLNSAAIGHICGLPEASRTQERLSHPPGDYVEFIPSTEFHKNGLVPITVPAKIMKQIGMGERERVILIKQVSKGKFAVPRYLGDARRLPSFSPERWSTDPSPDQVIAERLDIQILNQRGGVSIIIPEKWVWTTEEGYYNDGPPMVVNGAKVVSADIRENPYYFG